MCTVLLWNVETVFESVKRTGRAVIVRAVGVGAEIAAKTQSEALLSLGPCGMLPVGSECPIYPLIGEHGMLTVVMTSIW